MNTTPFFEAITIFTLTKEKFLSDIPGLDMELADDISYGPTVKYLNEAPFYPDEFKKRMIKSIEFLKPV